MVRLFLQVERLQSGQARLSDLQKQPRDFVSGGMGYSFLARLKEVLIRTDQGLLEISTCIQQVADLTSPRVVWSTDAAESLKPLISIIQSSIRKVATIAISATRTSTPFLSKGEYFDDFFFFGFPTYI